MSDSEILEQLEITPDLIKYTVNPSHEMQITAVSKNPKLIQYINDPCVKAQHIAIDHDPKLIEFIEKPDQSLEKKILKMHYPLLIKFDSISIDSMKHAFANEPDLFVKFKDKFHIPDEIIIYVLRRKGVLIKHIENPSLKHISSAIKNNPKSVGLVSNLTPEIQIMACKINHICIKFIKNQTQEVVDYCLSKSYSNLYYIEDKFHTEELYLKLMDVSPSSAAYAIQYFRFLNEKIFKKVLDNDIRNFRFFSYSNYPITTQNNFAKIALEAYEDVEYMFTAHDYLFKIDAIRTIYDMASDDLKVYIALKYGTLL